MLRITKIVMLLLGVCGTLSSVALAKAPRADGCLNYLVKGQGKPSSSPIGAKNSAQADCRGRCAQGEIAGCSTGWLCKPVRYIADPAVTPPMYRFDVLARPCPPRRAR